MWMFEWTGREFSPGVKDASRVYQRMHQYAQAAVLLEGKHVLDVAPEHGHGPSILAEKAASVVAVVSSNTLASAAADRFSRSNLRFIACALDQLPSSHECLFDAVLCFDIGPRPPALDGIAGELKRLLKQDGLLIVSTSACEIQQKLREALASRFKTVKTFRQAICAGSSMWSDEDCSADGFREFLMARGSTDEFRPVQAPQAPAQYWVSIATDLEQPPPAFSSVFIDAGNEWINDKQAEAQDLIAANAYQMQVSRWYEDQLAQRRESLASLQEAFAWRESQVESLNKSKEYLETEIAHYRNTVASNEDALSWRAAQVEEYERKTAALQVEAAALQVEAAALLAERENLREKLHDASTELAVIKAGAGWKLILKMRALRDRLFPKGSLRHRLYRAMRGLQ